MVDTARQLEKRQKLRQRQWSWPSSLLTVPLLCLAMTGQAQALPGDGTVVAGQADITLPDSSTMNIVQGSDKAIINWQSFSIGNGETVRFLQPGAHALAVNRVLGDDPSSIFGSLIANGQVMLINPNGILFGPSSRIDVNSLVATTIDITDDKILNNNFSFDIPGNSSAAIVNRGTITAADGGLVALVAPGVSNDGVIQARLGKVTLAGADSFSIDLYGDGLVSLPVSTRTVDEIVDAEGNPLSVPVSNSGEIRAAGGQVLLAARTAKTLVDDVVNMEGLVEAQSVSMRNGVIVLDGGGGTTRVSGTINVSGKDAGEKGGTVSITGKKIVIADGAVIDASGDAGGGTIHIGGEYQGGGDTPRADATTVEAGTLITASAVRNGDGGEVIVWSDDKTKIGGTIRADGGSDGGNGGLIETSGKGTLSVAASACVGAVSVHGTSGLWLLDPRDVYLQNGVGDDVSGGGVYNPTIDDASVDISTIAIALAGGTSVTITTNDAGGAQPGNITLVDAMNVAPTGAATLTLLAENNIILNNSITSTGALGLTLNAAGNIIQNAGTVNTDGGNITLDATDITVNGGFNAGAGSIFVIGNAGNTIALGAGGGNMNLSAGELAAMNAALLKIGDAAAGAITIGGDITPAATTLHLQSGSTITGTAGGIIATNLALQAGGVVDVTDTSTNAGTVAIGAAGQNISFRDTGGMVIGSVNGVSGLNGNNITLTNDGAITDTQATTANNLTINNTGAATTLDHAGNDVNSLTLAASGQTVTFNDVDDVDMANVTANVLNLTAGGAVTDSLDMVTNTLNITAGGNVTLDRATNLVGVVGVNAGANDITLTDVNGFDISGLTGGTVTLTGNGALTDSGNIVANTLNVTSTGAVTFNSAGNDVNNLFLSAGGQTAAFTDTDGINLAGITANSFTVNAGGAVTDSAAIAANTLNVTAGGAITLDEAGNDVTTLTLNAGGNAATYNDATGFDIAGLNAGTTTLTAGGAITDSGAISAGNVSITAGGNVTLDHAANNVTGLGVSAVGQDVVFNDASGLNLTGINANNFTLTTGGAVTDSAATTVTTLNVTSTGAVTLDHAGNDADTIVVSAAGQAVTYTDTDEIVLNGINSGSMTVNAGGTVTDTAAITTGALNVTATGAVTLDHAANNVTDLTVSAAGQTVTFNDVSGLNLAGINANNFILTAGGAVTDSAATIAPTINITASGAVTLDHAAGDADNLTINAGANAVTFVDTDALIIEGITATTANITTGGTLDDNGVINAGTLNVTAGGAVTIDNLANAINVFSANAAGQNVTYSDANGIDLAGITANNFTLTAGGAVTDSAGTVVNTLDVTAGGAVTMDHAANNAVSIDIDAGANAITYTDVSGFDIAGLTGSSATLTAGGAITDSTPIIISDLNITSTGAVTLDEAANDVDTLNVSAAGQTVTFTDTDGLDLDGMTAGTFTLTAGGAVTDSATIAAANLNVTATGPVTLDVASNDADNLMISAAGQDVTFRDTDGLNLAGITANNFTVQTGGAITDSVASAITGLTTITAGANAITLDQAANDFGTVTIASGGATMLVDTDDITLGAVTLSGALNTQANTGVTVSGAVSANGITIDADVDDNGTGDVTVGGGGSLNSNNNVMTVTANDLTLTGTMNSGSAATILRVSDNGTIDLGNGGGGDFNMTDAELDQITASTLRIGDAAGGAVTISSDIDPAAVTSLHLLTGGTITGTAGGIDVTNLAMTAGGTVNITDATTDVSVLAVSAPGQAVTFNNAGAVDIGTVDGVAGITGSTLTLTTGGAITDSAATIVSDLNITSAGDVVMDVATNDADNLIVSAAGQDVTFRDADGINLAGVTSDSLTLQAGGAVTDSVALTMADLNITATGAITLDEAGTDIGDLFINAAGQTAIVNDVDGINLDGITAGTLTLTANGTVTDSAASAVTNLNVTTTGAVTLDDAANDADNLMISAAGQAVSFTDADGVNLAGITADTFNLTTGGAVTDSAATSVTSLGVVSGGAVTMDHAANEATTIAINAAGNNVTYVDATGFDIGTVGVATGLTGDIMSLTAGGAVTDSAASIGTSLGVTATGDVTLDMATNNMTNIGISAAGQVVTYRDQNAVNIDNVGGANGITAASLDIQVGGTLTDSAATAVTGHTNLTAGGATVTWDDAGNDFSTVDIISAGNTNIADTDDITFTNVTGSGALTVNAQNGITFTGSSVTNGTTNLNADSDNDGTGTFTLNAAQTITTSNDAVTISAGDLVLDGTIGTGTGQTVVQATGGNTIDVGLGVGGQFNVTQAEIDAITAGSIRIGGANSGAMTITSNISAANSTALFLRSGSTIDGSAGAVTENSLALQAAGTITMTANNDVNTLAISNAGQITRFVDVDGFNFGSAAGLNGVEALSGGIVNITAGGDVTDSSRVRASNMAITTTGNIVIDRTDTNFGNVAFSNAGQTVTFGDSNGTNIGTVDGVVGITTGTLNVTINGDLTDSAASTVTGTATIDTNGNDVFLDLGTNDFSTLVLTDAAQVTVRDANDLTLGTVNATANTDIRTVNGLTVAGDQTIGGTLVLHADTNGDSAGTLTFNTGTTTSTAGGGTNMTLTGADLDIVGTAAITSGAGITTLQASDANRSIDIGGVGAVFNIAQTELDAITADTLRIQSGAGAGGITINTNMTTPGTNNLRLQSGTGGITATAGSVSVQNLALQTGGTGAITMTNAASDVDNLAITAGTGVVQFTDADSVNIGAVDGITGLNGTTVRVNAAGITDSSPSTVTNFAFTSTGAVTLDEAANDFNVIAASAGGQSVTVVDADGLDLGQVNAGGAINGITADTLTLTTGAALTDSQGSNIATLMTLNTGANAVTLDHAANDFNAVNITAAGNTVLRDTDDITLGASTVGGTLDVNANNGITVSGNVTTTGVATFDADFDNNASGTMTVDAARTVNTTNTALNITAHDLALNGNLTSGTADTSIDVSNGQTIGVGDTAQDMTISKAELLRITADNLIIGGTTAGDIRVDNIAAADLANVADTLYLRARGNGSDLRFINNASEFKTVVGDADDSVFVDQDLSSTVGQISLTADFDTAADPDGDQIYVTTGVTITAASSSTFVSTDGIVIGQNVDIFGDLVINADSDNNGTGSLTLNGGNFIHTNDYNLTLIAADYFLNGLIDTGTGILNISATNGRSIGVGDALGDAQISKAELQNISAGSLYIGGANAGNIVVDNVAALDVAGIDGQITMAALGAGSTVTFNNGNSVFDNPLSLQANAGITLDADVTTTGIVTIDADEDNNGTGNLTITGGNTLTSGGADITITANDVALPGAINSGAGNTTILASDNAAIDLGGGAGGLNLSVAELGNITANMLTVGDASHGAITISNDIAFATVDTLRLRTGGTVTGTAGGVSVNNLGISAGGAVNLTDSAFDVDGLAINTTGAITFNDADAVNVTTVGGITDLTSGGNAITLRATDMGILQAVNAGAGNVTLEGGAGNTIGLGGAGGVLNLSAAELALITANTLHIGTAAADDITISADATLAGVTRLELQTGGAVTGTAGGLVVGDLDIAAGDTVNIADTTTDVNTLNVNAAGQSITFFDADDLTASLVGASAHISANNGITLAADFTGTGASQFNADANNSGTGIFTLNAGVDVNIGNNTLDITARDMALNATSTMSSGTADTNIIVSNGGTISLGGAGGNMALSSAELDTITAGTLRIGDATAGAITIAGDIAPAGTSILHLRTGAGITGTAGGITETNLALTAGGTINITDATNNVTNLAISAPGQTVTFHDSNALNIGTVDSVVGINAGTVNLNTGGALSDANAITAGTLNVTSAGSVTLDHAANDFNILNVSAAGQTVTINDADDLDMSGLNAGTMNLTAGGAITDSGTLLATNLNVTAGGPITLNTAANDADVINLSAPGQNITFVDTDGFDVAGLTGQGLSLSAGGAVTDSGTITGQSLTLNATGGPITLNSAASDVDDLIISAAGQTVAFTDADGLNLAGVNAGTVSVNTGGALTDSAATTATTLNVTSTGPVTLDSAANDVDNLNISAAGQAATFVDTDGFNINALNAQTATLSAGGAVTDSGTITAQTLNLTSTGAVTLDSAANDVDDLIVSAAGQTVAFTDADGLNLAGINAGTFTVNAGGAVTDSASITATTLDITTSGGGVTLNNAGHDVTNLAVAATGQNVTYIDTNGFNINGLTGSTVQLTAAGPVTDSGTITAGSLNITGTGSITLDQATNDVDDLIISAAGQNVVFTDADGINLAGVTAGNFTLSSGGIVTDSAALATGTFTLTSTGAVTLDHAANDVDNLALSAAGQTVTFNDADGINLNNTTAGTLNLTAGGAVTDSGAMTATNANITATGPVTLNTAANDVDNLNVQAAGQAVTFVDADGLNIAGLLGSTLQLTAGGALTDSGTITGTSLNITGTGTITLDSATNDVDDLNISAAGQTATFRDADGLNLTGITAGTFNVQTGGALTDSGTIAATTLNVTNPSGAVTLNTAANDVDNLNVQAAGQAVTFVDADGVNLSGGNMGSLNLTAGGAIADSAAVTVTGATTLAAGANNIVLDVTTNNFNTVTIASANNVTLRDSNTLTLNGFTTAGTVDVQTNNGLVLAGNITSGTATYNADRDNNSSGVFTVNGGVAVSSGNNNMTVTARDMAINGTLSSGTGITALQVSNGGTISLGGAGGNLALTNAELDAITAGTLRIGSATAGAITVVADIAPAGTSNLRLQTGSTITGAAGGITETNVALMAGTGINLSDTTTDIGTLAASTTAGNINVLDNGLLSIGTVDGVTGITATAGNVTLQAGDMAINQAINNTGGITTLLGTAGQTISLGGTGGNLALTGAELNQITAGTLRIGDATAGAMTIESDIAPSGTSTVHLRTGSSITGTAGGITETNLAMSAGTGITLTDSTTDIGTVAAATTTGAMNIEDNGLLSIGTVDGVSGLTATGGNMTIRAGDMDITQPVNNTGGITTLLTTAGNTISLGGAGGALALTNAELNAIAASTLRIGEAASGAITIVSDIAPTGTSILHLRTGSTITGTAGGITETNLALEAGGTININDATTDIGTLAISAPGQSVTLHDASALAIGTVDGVAGLTAGTATLNTGGALTDSAAITAGTLNVTSTGPVTLDTAANDVDNLNVQAAGQTITFVDADGLNLTGLNGTTATLTTGGALTDSGTITAGTLNVTSTGPVTLNTAANDVDNLNIGAAGQNITFVDADGFNVNALNGQGITLTGNGALTQSGAITGQSLTVTNTGGATTLTHAGNDVDDLSVSAAGQTVSFTDADAINLAGINAGTFTLNNSGAVTDSGATIAGTLNVTSTGPVTLNTATNDVDNLNISAAGQPVVFVDTDGFNINALTAQNATLTGGGAITDSGTITAQTLNITNTGSVTLDSAASDVDDLTISAAGQTVTFTDADGINLAGINAGSFSVNASGAVTDSAAITAGTLNVTATGAVTLDHAASDVDNLNIQAAGQTASFTDTDGVNLSGLNAGTFTLNAAGAVTDSGTLTAGTLNVTTTGAVTLDTAANDVDNLNISAAGQTVTFVDTDGVNINGLTGQTLALTSGGAITQSGAITGQSLTVTSAGGVTLTHAGNDVDDLGVSAAGQAVAFTDSDGINLTGINAGSFTLNTSGAVTDSAASTVTGATSITAGAGNNVTLDHAGNDFNSVAIVSGNNVTLNDINAITLNGSTIAGLLNTTAASGITIGGPVTVAGAATLDADVDNNGSGDFTINGGQSLGVSGATLTITANDMVLNGTLNNGAGITTILASDNGTISLGGAGGDMAMSTAEMANITAGTLRIGDASHGAISVVGAITPNVDTLHLRTGAGVTGAGGAVTVDNLAVSAAGAVTLNNAGNDVDVVAINAAGQAISFRDADGAVIDTVDGVTGINGGAVTLQTGGTLTGNAAITATTLDVTSGGTVDLNNVANTVGTLDVDAAGQDVFFRDVDALVLNDVTAGTLTLNTSGAVTDTGTIAVSGATVIEAGAGNDITLDTSANDFNTVAITTGRNVTLRDTNALTINASTISGTLDAGANNGLSINGAVTSNGTTTMNADLDNNASGVFAVNGGGSLATNNGALNVFADDVTVNGAINTGSGSMAITSQPGATWGLGNAAGDVTLSGAELQNITTAGLTLGGATAGSMSVDGVSAAQSSGIGALTLNALGNNSTIEFVNNASTFQSLSAQADAGIDVDVNLTTSAGAMTLDGDADDANDAGSDAITYAASVALSSQGALSLSATTGGGIMLGNLSLGAATGDITLDALDGAGTLSASASAGDITITDSVGDNTPLANAVLTANDITGDIHATTMTLDSDSAVMTGTINGLGGQDAADLIILIKTVPGPYLFNGFIIEGYIPPVPPSGPGITELAGGQFYPINIPRYTMEGRDSTAADMMHQDPLRRAYIPDVFDIDETFFVYSRDLIRLLIAGSIEDADLFRIIDEDMIGDEEDEEEEGGFLRFLRAPPLPSLPSITN